MHFGVCGRFSGLLVALLYHAENPVHVTLLFGLFLYVCGCACACRQRDQGRAGGAGIQRVCVCRCVRLRACSQARVHACVRACMCALVHSDHAQAHAHALHARTDPPCAETASFQAALPCRSH